MAPNTTAFRLAILTLAALLSWTPLSQAEPATGTRAMEPMTGKTLRVKRPTLLVRDLQRSIDFYTDVLGLELFDVEPNYNTDPESLGYPLFNLPPGVRKRMAYFNTSDEVRGFAVEEVLDFDWSVQQRPRTSVVLFETDDIENLERRLRDGGHTVWTPARGDNYGLRFAEIGFLDPDGHLIAAFQVFEAAQSPD